MNDDYCTCGYINLVSRDTCFRCKKKLRKKRPKGFSISKYRREVGDYDRK